MNKNRPMVIAVAGGSGSGKTTIVEKILEEINTQDVLRIQHDFYYKDHANLPLQKRETLNYDHPNSLETPLLVEHLKQLLKGHSVMIPRYDFSTHTRKPDLIETHPCSVIIVEGILIFTDPALIKLFDIKIFVDTPADLRFIRRVERDRKERNRSYEQTRDQWIATVRPMHLEFVEPSRVHSNIRIPQEEHNSVAIDMFVAKIRWIIARSKRKGITQD
ncbi:MAG: uridine kinase [Patescibacteria group bacterium]|nr:uridine kinase [Patescibacteria group bacterium]